MARWGGPHGHSCNFFNCPNEKPRKCKKSTRALSWSARLNFDTTINLKNVNVCLRVRPSYYDFFRATCSFYLSGKLILWHVLGLTWLRDGFFDLHDSRKGVRLFGTAAVVHAVSYDAWSASTN